MNKEENVRNVVLVHGGFVDGSGWEGVYDALKKNGYAVSIVQNAMTSPPLGARLLSRTDRSFSSATRTVALSSPKPVLIRRLLDFRQSKRAARHLYPNLPRNMLAK
jgi:hypothetical protein